MKTKNIFFIFFTYFLFMTSHAFAAETYQIVIFKEFGKPCPACDTLKRNLGLLKKNEGLDFTIKEQDASNLQNFSANPELRYPVEAFPVFTIVKSADGKKPLIISRQDASLFDEMVLSYGNLKRMIGAAPLATVPPPVTVPPPKPQQTGNSSAASVAVQPDQVPKDSAFTSPLNCSLQTSGPHKGEYRCQYVNEKGVLMEMFVGPAQRDFFDTIANLAKNKEILLADPKTGLVRPFSRPTSQLPDTLPPVPGDPGYVPPQKLPKVTPVSGNDDWDIVTPKKPVTYTHRIISVGDYIKEADSWQVEVERCSVYADGKKVCENIVLFVAATPNNEAGAKAAAERAINNFMRNMGLATVTPKPIEPAVKLKSPVVSPPLVAPKAKYQLSKPVLNSKTGMYEVGVSMCTDSACVPLKNSDGSPLILQVPKSDAKDIDGAKELIEKYLKDNGVPPEYLPKPKTPKVETPPDTTGKPAPYRRGVVNSPEPTKVGNNMRELTAQEKADLAALEKQVGEITAKYADPKLTAAGRAALDKQATDLAEKISDIMNGY